MFSDAIWPAEPSLDSFWIVLTQGYWYLEYFWRQFGNSVYIGVATIVPDAADRLAGQLLDRAGCGCATAGCSPTRRC